MRLALLVCFAALFGTGNARAAEWRVQRVDTPARVTAIETVDGRATVNAGGLWYRIDLAGAQAKLIFFDMPPPPKPPAGALPDGRVVTGTRDIARVWLAEPTGRYDHGILGDATEAGSLMIEAKDGKIHTVRLKDNAVFEDLEPRIADFDGDGVSDIAVPSLDRGHLRIVSFAPAAREIASLPLPAKAVTNIALIPAKSGAPAIAAGLADGALVVIRND